MCLTIHKKKQGLNIQTLEILLNEFSKISNKDIIVYKVLKVDGEGSYVSLRTLYQY